MEGLVRQAQPGARTAAAAQTPGTRARPPRDRRAARSRALRLAVVASVFAALGAITPGELGAGISLVTAELVVSLAAAALLVASLLSLREA
jgi:hypothetical protein